METDDVPLLNVCTTESEEGLRAGEFHYLHGIWFHDDNDSEPIFDEQMQRASSLKSNLSQEPPLQSSEPLSQITEPCEERVKVSRKEAFDLLKTASSLTEAAQKALEKVTGDEFLDASADELSTRDNFIENLRKKLGHLQSETRKRKWKVKNPDQTFLSSSACEDIFELKKCKGDAEGADVSEKVTQTTSQGVQTDGGGLGLGLGGFKKPFDQLKATGVYILSQCLQFF